MLLRLYSGETCLSPAVSVRQAELQGLELIEEFTKEFTPSTSATVELMEDKKAKQIDRQ